MTSDATTRRTTRMTTYTHGFSEPEMTAYDVARAATTHLLRDHMMSVLDLAPYDAPIGSASWVVNVANAINDRKETCAWCACLAGVQIMG
jgi:hypothetical protein